jgi:hypothetical protein
VADTLSQVHQTDPKPAHPAAYSSTLMGGEQK